MKKFLFKVAGILVAMLPVMTMLAMTVSANTLASPLCGQPTPPKSLKKYRKF